MHTYIELSCAYTYVLDNRRVHVQSTSVRRLPTSAVMDIQNTALSYMHQGHMCVCAVLEYTIGASKPEGQEQDKTQKQTTDKTERTQEQQTNTSQRQERAAERKRATGGRQTEKRDREGRKQRTQQNKQAEAAA